MTLAQRTEPSLYRLIPVRMIPCPVRTCKVGYPAHMPKRVAVFWPGDARAKPNELALPNVEEATRAAGARAEATRARRRIGSEGFLSKPARGDREARPGRRPDRRRLRALVLRPAHDRRRRGQGQPAAAREQLLRPVARARGPAQHGRVPGDRSGARSRARGPTRPTGRRTTRSWTVSPSGASRGASPTPRTRSPTPRPCHRRRCAVARDVADEIRERRVLVLMLGDTSMGMINGYFGPRLLNPTASPSTRSTRRGSSTAGGASTRSASTTPCAS